MAPSLFQSRPVSVSGRPAEVPSPEETAGHTDAFALARSPPPRFPFPLLSVHFYRVLTRKTATRRVEVGRSVRMVSDRSLRDRHGHGHPDTFGLGRVCRRPQGKGEAWPGGAMGDGAPPRSDTQASSETKPRSCNCSGPRPPPQRGGAYTSLRHPTLAPCCFSIGNRRPAPYSGRSPRSRWGSIYTGSSTWASP